MGKLTCVVVALLAVTALPPSGERPEQLGWLAGCWTSQGARSTTVEMWLPPSGGLMVGGSRTMRGGEAVAWEHLRIRADGSRIVFTAIPSGQTEADFVSVALDEYGFTVENLDHDFPQRIIYRRTAPDAVTVRVEAEASNGTEGFDVFYERTRCEVAGKSPEK